MPATEWRLTIEDCALKDLDKIGENGRVAVLRYSRQRVLPAPDPRSLGKALRGDLAGLWRYRIAEWRVIAELDDDRLVLHVVRVGNRRNVYHR